MQFIRPIAGSLIALAIGCLGAIAQTTTPTTMPGCVYNSGALTLTNGQIIPWQCDVNGKLITTAGSGTVTSIATTSPITGGPITTTGTIACATCVTSASALTLNSLMIGQGSQASAITTTGTGVLTALGVNIGTAGAFVVNGGALGTPSSGTATNITGVTLSGHATQATNTVVGNATSGTASPTALAVGTCSTAGSALIWTTNTGFGCNTSITAAAVAVGGITGLGTGVATALANNVGSAGAPVTFNGAGGTPSSMTATNVTGLPIAGITTFAVTPQGRLTLTTATPVMSTTVSGATTIYYTPYVGNLVPIYDGTNMVPTACAEISNATAQSSTGSAGPAVVANTSVYDLFVWNNSGTCTLTRGPLWTDGTTRSAGTALVRTNGIWLNNASITNGPAASRGTYVGTVRSNGSATIDYIFGAGSAGGTAAVLYVWNAYNRVTVTTLVTDTTASWNTATSAAAANMDGSATNRISAVFGLAEDGINVGLSVRMQTATAGFGIIGFGMDATAFDKRALLVAIGATVIVNQDMGIHSIYAPQLGAHFWQATQAGDGADAATIFGDLDYIFAATLRM